MGNRPNGQHRPHCTGSDAGSDAAQHLPHRQGRQAGDGIVDVCFLHMAQPLCQLRSGIVAEDGSRNRQHFLYQRAIDLLHRLAPQQILQAKQQQQKYRRADISLVNAQGEEAKQHQQEAAVLPALERPNTQYRQQERQAVGIRVRHIGSVHQRHGGIHRQNAAHQPNQPRVLNVQQLHQQVARKGQIHQRQNPAKSREGQVAPQQPIDRAQESPYGNHQFRSLLIQGVQGIVVEIGVHKAVAVGCQSQREHPEKHQLQFSYIQRFQPEPGCRFFLFHIFSFLWSPASPV